jgi:outer membrane protein OmpA-like peptidoglycan-associated protein
MNKNLLTAGILAGTLTLTGCATGPMSDQLRTGQGAAIGAAAGGLLGNVLAGSGAKTGGTLIGAAIGATVGGLIGNRMDKQEAGLRSNLSGTGISVDRQGDTLRLSAPAAITFDTGRSAISPTFERSLDEIATSIQSYPGTVVRVEGHTDSTGGAQSNQYLSLQRAQSVTTYLARKGVDTERLQPVGFGESRPVATNDTIQGRTENRRVEILIVPEA